MTLTGPSKILSFDELLAVVRERRAAGRTIVHCHGCFDVVHPGHIRYLEFARGLGEVLIVSLTGDIGVNKGANRPYIPQELRAENLAALSVVDYVYINPEPTAEKLLSTLRPDLYVKGKEYETSRDSGFLAEKAVVEGYGGRLVFSSGEVVFSSTELIGKLPKNVEAITQRLGRICRDHDITQISLDALIDQFRGRRVLVLGDVVIDHYVFCDAIGIAGEGPMMSLVQRDERRYVGGAAIVARHIAALGAQASLVGAAAGKEDADTRMVCDVLDEENVECHVIQARPGLVQKTRFLAEDSKLFKVDRAQRIPLDSAAERDASRILERQSRGADAVILCDFGYGCITQSLLTRVLPVLRHNGRVLTADVSGGQANLLNFKNADLLCPTEREVRATLHDHDSGVSNIAWEVLQRTHARNMLITLGKRGLLVFERQSQKRDTPEWSARLKSEQLPAFVNYAVDTLGCGDALLAGATLALACGATVMQAAYLGNACAALEAQELGNIPVSADRLREALCLRPELAASPPIDTPESIFSPSIETAKSVSARAAAIL